VEFLPLSPDKHLAPEDLVVLVGQDRLKDGDLVRIESADSAPPIKLTPTDTDGSTRTNGKD
ncbi:MAG: hypothetical protein HRU14_08515, partial [Planctomycetes bacterium]|nr:hypothetical protein [Planctomycetota bacterium]